MMSSPDAAAGGGGSWCCYNDTAGKAAAAVPTTGEARSFFADIVADYSTDDLFELVWEQEGQAGGGAPAVSCLWSPKFSKPPDDVRFDFDPPSEDEMAAWLGTIVKGEELASCNDDDGGRRPMADDNGLRDVLPATMGTSTVTDKKEKQVPTPTTEGNQGMMMGNNKAMARGSSRRSHHGEAHNLTEKRRRHKINERLKTLQQLVPGCSKSNQASTLDQTIHYMKTLQHQVQAMSVGGLAAPAVYPVVQPQCVTLGTPVAMPFPAAPMVPFGTTMLQLPDYTAAAVMMPLYPSAAPTSTAVAPGPGDAMSANRLRGYSSRNSSEGRGKGSSSMYQSMTTQPDHYENTRKRKRQ